MSSIIKNAETLGITYAALSKSLFEGNRTNVFTDDDSSFFRSQWNILNQWWQVSFSKPVAIKSYIIRTNASFGSRPKSWTVHASLDNESWQLVDEVSLQGDIGGSTTPFLLKKTIKCKHFRIYVVKNTWNNNELYFTFFDCFGELRKYTEDEEKGYLRFFHHWKFKIFYHVFLSAIMNLFINKHH